MCTYYINLDENALMRSDFNSLDKFKIHINYAFHVFCDKEKKFSFSNYLL